MRAMKGTGAGFGEQGRTLDYGAYLRIPELLDLQRSLTSSHDEMLFIIVHQAYELWFRLILHELEAARDAMSSGDAYWPLRHLHRVAVVQRVLMTQVDVLDTMAPDEFLRFRSELVPASGFQSVQFREIEFLSGLKDADYLDRIDATADEESRLRRRLREPSLWDAFCELLRARHVLSLHDLFWDRPRLGDLFELSEALLDHDQAFSLWRARHLQMVERQIGAKPGTGGSTGTDYLRTTLDKRFFPELLEIRSRLELIDDGR
jgi:tryptophan 2,3-dioxygenase